MHLPRHTSLTFACRRLPHQTFHLGPQRGEELQGMRMQILQLAALCCHSPLPGVLMPKPAQNIACPGIIPQSMLNADFTAHTSPGLAGTLSLLTVWGKVDCTYHRHISLVRVSLSFGHVLQGSVQQQPGCGRKCLLKEAEHQ